MKTSTSMRTTISERVAAMPNKQTGKGREKSYSYDEYRKTFYPKPRPEHKLTFQEPKSFGGRLAEEALKKIKSDLPRK